jgi:hypothetical protein
MKLFDTLSDDLASWIQKQPVFSTGSAPTHAAHVNVSPKGLSDSHFAIIDANRCAYIDRTGSGCETVAHAYENGRLCLMFMSFGESPRILRLFCRARVVEFDQPDFADWVRRVSQGKRSTFDGARAVIICDIWQVQTSCGYAVPRVKKDFYTAESKEENDELVVFEERPTLDKWAKTQADGNKILEYQTQKNSTSIDGLPGLKSARRRTGQTMWLEDVKARTRKILAEKDAIATGFAFAIICYCVFAGLGLL